MHIKLYTDGACRGNGQVADAPSGIGAVLLIPEKQPIYLKEKLNFKPNTNNKAEIFAVIRGLELLFEYYSPFDKNEFVKDKLTIYSDSAYMINGITNWINDWRENNWMNSKKELVKNKELWEYLDKRIHFFEQDFDIEFVKVKGHSGNKWNEKCDRLANEAMEGI